MLTTELSAGQELDALVATRVMGARVALIPDPPVAGFDPVAVLVNDENIITAPVPNYSTDIGDAWTVVKWAAARGYAPVVAQGSAVGWECILYPRLFAERVTATAETAPLAICRAALAILAK